MCASSDAVFDITPRTPRERHRQANSGEAASLQRTRWLAGAITLMCCNVAKKVSRNGGFSGSRRLISTTITSGTVSRSCVASFAWDGTTPNKRNRAAIAERTSLERTDRTKMLFMETDSAQTPPKTASSGTLSINPRLAAQLPTSKRYRSSVVTAAFSVPVPQPCRVT